MLTYLNPNTIDLNASWITQDEDSDNLEFTIQNPVCCDVTLDGSVVTFEYDESQERIESN